MARSPAPATTPPVADNCRDQWAMQQRVLPQWSESMAPRILFLLLVPSFFVFSLSRLPLAVAAAGAANITFFGNAARRNNGINLTRNRLASASSAVFGRPLRFLDPVTKSLVSFATSSSFGYGFAFSPSLTGYMAMATSAPPPATAVAGQDTIIAVEYDTAFTSTWATSTMTTSASTSTPSSPSSPRYSFSDKTF